MPMPTNGTKEQIYANQRSNRELANDLRVLRTNRRAFPKAYADAVLDEAARRLQWRDAYDNNGGDD